MFHNLNDDCWFTILKYVDLYDQISVAKISKRLENIVRYHWQHLKTVNVDAQLIEYFTEHPKEMQVFLHSTRKTVQNMRLDEITFDTLTKWNGYIFPKLMTCEINLGNNNVGNAEKNRELLSQPFPNLQSLTLKGHMSSDPLYIYQLTNLKELNLIDSFCNFELIGRYLSLRKLSVLYYSYGAVFDKNIQPVSDWTGLEELVIRDHHLLGDFIYNLMQLPKFQRLAFYTCQCYGSTVERLSKQRPLRVKSLLFNDSYWASSDMCQAVMTMKNLERFALYNDDIRTYQLHMICTNLPNLKELHLTGMRSLPTATQLWNMVGCCKTLRILNLSGSQLDEHFVEMSVLCLDKVLMSERAISPFTLCLYNSSIKESSQVFNDLKHPHLKVSFDPIPLDVFSASLVEVLFTTSPAHSPA